MPRKPVVKSGTKPKDGQTRYPQGEHDDVLALQLEGLTPREIRRALLKKWDSVPCVRSIRNWCAKARPEIQAALVKNKTDILDLLERESDFVEDRSDDILNYVLPNIMEELQNGGLEGMSMKEKLDIVLRELNNKSNRNDRKLQLAHARKQGERPPIAFFFQNAQAKQREKEAGGPGATIIDVEIN